MAAHELRGDRDRASSYDIAQGATERGTAKARTLDEAATERVYRLRQEVESAAVRAKNLAGIVQREEWRAERKALAETHATWAASLADFDAKASSRVEEHYAAIRTDVAEIARVLTSAKEPRAVPAVSGEETIEPLILGRSATADDVLAWVAGLGKGERHALADRVRRVQGTADRKDGFAVGLANYLAGSRTTSQFFGVIENPRRFDRAAYMKARADATAFVSAPTAEQGAHGRVANAATGDQALPTPGVAGRTATNASPAAPAIASTGPRGTSTAASRVLRQKQAAAPGAAQRTVLPAAEYANQTRPLILASITERVAHVGLVQPHARLCWSADPQAITAVAAAIRDYVDAAPELALKRMMNLSYPADLERVIDEARNGRSGTAWMLEVGRAVAEAFDEPLVVSIQRMGLRLRVHLDGDAHRVMPRGSSLIASCPLDGVIADVLVAPGMVTSQAKHRATEDTPGRPFANGVQEVEYQWLGARDPQLWNWIHVTAPKNATAEHVAHTPLAGGKVISGSEQAYRIAASPPYFGIPIETARLVREAWDYAPDELKTAAKANDLGPRVADGTLLATSVIADEAALAQADASGKADLSVDHALDRAHIQLAFLKQALAPWHAHLALGGAQAFLLRRSDELMHDSRRLHRWAPALVNAEHTLRAVASEVAVVFEQLSRSGAKPEDAAALGPMLEVIRAYAHAAGVCHLGAEAPAALAEARRSRSLLPIALAEQRLRVARSAVADQQRAQREAGRVEDRSGESISAIPELATRAADLRLRAARGDGIDTDAADELAVDADETALRAQITTLQTQLATLERCADDVKLSVTNPAGWTIQKTTAHLRHEAAGWLAQLDRTKDPHRTYGTANAPGGKRDRIDGARRTIATVRRELVDCRQKAEIGEFINFAYDRIADKRFRDALVAMALQIGVMIATGEVAGAAVAALRGVALAREAIVVGELIADVRRVGLGYQVLEATAQAYLVTKAQGAMGGPSGAGAFTENLLGVALTGAVLKPFEGLLGDTAALERELHTWSGSAKAGARFAATAPLEIGAGIGAAGAARAVTHGGEAPTTSADDVVTQGISLVASKFVHRHTLQMRARIEGVVSGADRAQADALLHKVDALSHRALAAGERSTPEETRAILVEHAALLPEEARLYEHATGKGPDAARQQSARDQTALSGHFVEVSFRIAGLHPVVDGAVFEGTPEQIASAFATADQTGVPPMRKRDPQTGVWHVTSGHRTYDIHERGGAPRTGRDADKHPTKRVSTDVHSAEDAKNRSHELGDDAASGAATHAAVDALANVPVAKLPTGTKVVGESEGLPHDTYYVSQANAKHMLAALAQLEPTVQTRAYPKGFIVRRGAQEWYFEIHDNAHDLPVHAGPRHEGLPAPNVATVELWGFRGVRTIHGRPESEWTAAEKANVDQIKKTQPLLYSGHVGISSDGGKTIFGFTPRIPEETPPEVALRSLMAHDVYPGVVRNDTWVFGEAERRARQLGWNTQPISAVELVDKPKKIAVVQQVSEMAGMAPGSHGLGYSFPLPQPNEGQHFPGSAEFKPCDVTNCAGFPEKIGVPIPEPSCKLKYYMPELEKWANADRPMDFRTNPKGDEP